MRLKVRKVVKIKGKQIKITYLSIIIITIIIIVIK